MRKYSAELLKKLFSDDELIAFLETGLESFSWAVIDAPIDIREKIALLKENGGHEIVSTYERALSEIEKDPERPVQKTDPCTGDMYGG